MKLGTVDMMGPTNSSLSATIGPIFMTISPTLCDHATAANSTQKCTQRSHSPLPGIQQSSAASTSILSTWKKAMVECDTYYIYRSQWSSGPKLMLSDGTPLKHGPILFIKTSFVGLVEYLTVWLMVGQSSKAPQGFFLHGMEWQLSSLSLIIHRVMLLSNVPVNALMHICGDHQFWWPLYLHAILLAIHCTASWMTGHSPYYLLLGWQPLLAFDIADWTWKSLDWDKVVATEDIITIRAQQIAWQDNILEEALKKQRHECQCAVDDFNNRYEKYLVTNDFNIGTWVLVHKTWLDNQKGHKLVPWWTGPFAIHHKLSDTTYQIREIDGTIKQGKVSKNQLKLSYYRKDQQTIKSVSSSFHVFGMGSTPTCKKCPYTVAKVPLGGPDHVMWMVPCNVNLIKYQIFFIGSCKEYTHSMIWWMLPLRSHFPPPFHSCWLYSLSTQHHQPSWVDLWIFVLIC